MGAPNFSESFAGAIKKSARQRSWGAFVPWWLMICIFGPILAVYFLSFSIFIETDKNIVLVLFSSFAVVGGFLGSVSVASMAQIQKIASEYPFSDYLHQEKLFDSFIFFPQLILLMQILFIIYSSISMSIILTGVNTNIINYLIFIGLGYMVYITTKTWALLDLIRILTWHYEEYTRLYEEEKSKNNNILKGPSTAA